MEFLKPIFSQNYYGKFCFSFEIWWGAHWKIFIWCLYVSFTYIYQNQAPICLAHIFSGKTSSQVQWLVCSKSPLFGAFSGKNWENSNIPPLKNPQSFIERRPFNSADTVYNWWPKNERGCQVLREKQKQLRSAQKQWVWVTEKEKGMKWVRGCLRTFFPPFPPFPTLSSWKNTLVVW